MSAQPYYVETNNADGDWTLFMRTDVLGDAVNVFSLIKLALGAGLSVRLQAP